jgi:biopolymer transport protein ExbB
METQTEPSFGLAHIFTMNSGIGLIPPIILLLMSVATWYWILMKIYQGWQLHRRTQLFQTRFWECRSIAQVEEKVLKTCKPEPCSDLMRAGLQACQQLNQPDRGLLEMGSKDEFLLRALRRSITRSTLRVERGMTLLASVGSAAPFVGLFGTVWGIYHALMAISASGQSTLDKVAGPVGEALVMTGFGLAVALPAVLAYNAFVRVNRVYLAELDGFAHDIFALLVTGHTAQTTPATRPQLVSAHAPATAELQAGER